LEETENGGSRAIKREPPLCLRPARARALKEARILGIFPCAAALRTEEPARPAVPDGLTLPPPT
jgi:hypothetical protein